MGLLHTLLDGQREDVDDTVEAGRVERRWMSMWMSLTTAIRRPAHLNRRTVGAASSANGLLTGSDSTS